MADRKLEIVIGARDNYSTALKKFNAAMGGTVTKQEGLLTSLNSSWVKLGAQIYVAQKAVQLLSSTFDEMRGVAKFKQTEEAFANLAQSHGANAALMIEDLRAMSAETISTADLMQSAGSAMTLGIPADKLTEMMEIARASSRITGQSITKSFQDISTGLSRQSKQILDNLGIVVNADDAYKKYAETNGIMGRALNDSEKKQAFINATMESGAVIVDSIGVSGKSAAEEFDTFTAQLADLSIVLGEKVLPLFSSALRVVNSIIGTPLEMNDQLSALGKLRAEAEQYSEILFNLEEQSKVTGPEDRYQLGAKGTMLLVIQQNADRAKAKLAQINEQIAAMEKSYIAAHSTVKKTAETIADPALQKAYDAMEGRIHGINIATAKLTATKAEQIYIDAQELSIAGVTGTQLERYVDARERQLAVEKQLADAKAKTAAEEDAARQRERAQEQLAGLGAAPGGLAPEDEFSKAWLGYQAQLDALSQYNTQKLSLMAQAGASQAQMEAAYSEMVIDQEKKKRDFQLAAASQTFGGMSNIMQNLMVATGSRNKAMFKAMQGFAIAESLINTYQGATKAFATVPYPFNFVAAASVIAAGMAQVSKIRSQSPEGGGGAAISAGGAAAPEYSGGSTTAYPVPTRNESRPAMNVTVNAFALDPSSVNWDEMMEKQIAPALERLSNDRDVTLKIQVASR